jgi:pseudouridine kinase
MPKLFAIGGATVDLVGCPYKALKYQDSNPGSVKLSFGGVARNIAENATRCKTDVSLMALFGDDAFGKLCYQYCEDIGMDLSYSKILTNYRSATYLALLQSNGEMNCAIADMEILNKLTKNDFDIGIQKMTELDYCAIDTNLTVEVLEDLCQKIPARIAMDPISSQKAVKAKTILKHLSVFKPNLMEAELVCGFDIKDEKDIIKALDYLVMEGVKEPIITNGEKGVYMSNGIEKMHLYHDPVKTINTTGAGDAFLGVYLSYRLKGYNWIEACEWGLCASYITVQSEDTVLKTLSEETLKEVKSKLNIYRDVL